ncbi:MAG: alkyl/aryl-sulfatase [Pseudomonadota bacterium]
MTLKISGLVAWVCFSLAACAQVVPAPAEQQTDAERTLTKLNKELAPHFEQLTDNVYVASGYGVSTMGFIVGDEGVVVVDGGIMPPFTAQALKEFRKHSDLPIAAIIFTHGHGDHTGGALGLIEGNAQPQVWARANFGAEGRAFREAGITYDAVRGRRQGGFLLPMEKRINNGIAPAIRPPSNRNIFQADRKGVVPTHVFSDKRKTIKIAGLTLDLVAAPGETADQLYVWYPEKKVVFTGDNFYKSWPNLYAIRGTPYRDVRAWANAADMMLQEGPDYLVPGHTKAISGADQVADALIAYRDGIRFVFSKTVEGINKGLTPDELVDYVVLPKEYAEHPYLQPYYGNPQWAIRSIFEGYLGWFDGNPTNLQRYSKGDHAKRVIELGGGADSVLATARLALAKNDPQWAAELCDYLIAVNEHETTARLLKAEALETLGRNFVTAIGRNYYLTVAQQLRREALEAE